MPFAARQLSDPRHSALGLKECIGRQLLRVLPVDREANPDAVVAQYRFTVLLHGGKTISLADHRMQTLAPTRGPPADVIRKFVGSADKPAKHIKWDTHAHLPAAVAELPIGV